MEPKTDPSCTFYSNLARFEIGILWCQDPPLHTPETSPSTLLTLGITVSFLHASWYTNSLHSISPLPSESINLKRALSTLASAAVMGCPVTSSCLSDLNMTYSSIVILASEMMEKEKNTAVTIQWVLNVANYSWLAGKYFFHGNYILHLNFQKKKNNVKLTGYCLDNHSHSMSFWPNLNLRFTTRNKFLEKVPHFLSKIFS